MGVCLPSLSRTIHGSRDLVLRFVTLHFAIHPWIYTYLFPSYCLYCTGESCVWICTYLSMVLLVPGTSGSLYAARNKRAVKLQLIGFPSTAQRQNCLGASRFIPILD